MRGVSRTPVTHHDSELGSSIRVCAGVATGVGAGIGVVSGSITLGLALGVGLMVFMAVALCRGGKGPWAH